MAEFPNPPRSRKPPPEQLKAEENSFWESWGGTIKGAIGSFIVVVLLLIITSYLFGACGDSLKPKPQVYALSFRVEN
jgi:hypothetical protein